MRKRAHSILVVGKGAASLRNRTKIHFKKDKKKYESAETPRQRPAVLILTCKGFFFKIGFALFLLTYAIEKGLKYIFLKFYFLLF